MGDTTGSGCDPSDIKCLCSSEKFITGSAACFQEKCNDEDLKSMIPPPHSPKGHETDSSISATISAAYEICAAVGIPIPTGGVTTTSLPESTTPPAEKPTHTPDYPVESSIMSTVTADETPYPSTTVTYVSTGGPLGPSNTSTPVVPTPPANSDSAASNMGVAGFGALGLAVVAALAL